jgi:crossover junction endodeoxyribonuclease RuvC
MSVIIGLDPSFKRTACVVGDRLRHDDREFDAGQGSYYASLEDRIARAYALAAEVADWCRSKAPALIAIEGYSFYSNKPGHSDIIEYGGLLRLELLKACSDARFLEIPPTSVKRWACGKGNADKPYMADAIRERYRIAFPNFDQMDAWCVWRMACQYEGMIAAHAAHELDAVQSLLNPKQKAKAKRDKKRAKKLADAKQKKLEF